jgi:hypothetical protein
VENGVGHFIMTKQSNGMPIWINVDRVRYVAPATNTTKVYFDTDDTSKIGDQPSIIVDSSRKSREKR